MADDGFILRGRNPAGVPVDARILGVLGGTLPNTPYLRGGSVERVGDTFRALEETVGASAHLHGAKGDAVALDGAASIAAGSAALTVVGAAFTADDVGKTILVRGAGAPVTLIDGSLAGGPLVTTIVARTGATQVVLAAPAGTTLSAGPAAVVYGTDDTEALRRWIAYCMSEGVNGFARRRNYLTTGKLSLSDPENPIYWATNARRPPRIEIAGTLFSAHTDHAVDIYGIIMGSRVVLQSLSGPGVTAMGERYGSAECTGVRLGPGGGISLDIGQVTDFNVDLLLDGAFGNTINIGTAIASVYAVWARTGKPDNGQLVGAGANANNVRFNLVGGPYASYGNELFEPRRRRASHKGFFVEKTCDGNFFMGGTVEYCVRYDDSIAVHCQGANNTFTGYVEGSILGGANVLDEGKDNSFAGLADRATPSRLAKNTILRGIGGTVRLFNRVGATAKQFFTAGLEVGQVEVRPGNTIEGNCSETYAPVPSPLPHNFIAVPSAWSPANLTVVHGINDRPPELDHTGDMSSELTIATSSVGFLTSPQVNLGAARGPYVRNSIWVKALDRELIFCDFPINAATGQVVESDGYVTCLPVGEWKLLRYFADVRGVQFYQRRITIAGGDAANPSAGGRLLTCVPFSTQNIEAAVTSSRSPLLYPDVSPYKYFPDGLYLGEAPRLELRSVASLPSNLLDVARKPVTVITANPTSGAIGAIASPPKGAFFIVNQSGAAITVFAGAGLWGANFTIPHNTAVQILNTATGLVKLG